MGEWAGGQGGFWPVKSNPGEARKKVIVHGMKKWEWSQRCKTQGDPDSKVISRETFF